MRYGAGASELDDLDRRKERGQIDHVIRAISNVPRLRRMKRIHVETRVGALDGEIEIIERQSRDTTRAHLMESSSASIASSLHVAL